MNITVIGTGYVGLVTGACFSKMGNKVYCVDIDESKIEGLKNGILPIFEPHLGTMVKNGQEKGDLIFTTDIGEALDNTDFIFIAVGTPMSEDGSANLDYIFSAATDIAENITHDSLVVVKSTVPVGTPMSDDGSANLDYIFSAAKDIADNITHDSLVVIKSTVPVGTGFKVKDEIEQILKERNSPVKI